MWRCAVFLLALWTGPCLAGPWPREAGTFFLSTGLNSEPAASLYLEYGLGNDWTVGVDAYGTWTYTGHAAAFASRSFALPSGLQFATEAAVVMRSDGMVALDPWGQAYGLGVSGPDLRIGASLGRGIDIMSGGWATAASSMTFGDVQSQKFELTLGVSPSKWSKVYGQLQGTHNTWGQIWRAETVAGLKISDSHEFLLSFNAPFGEGETRIGLQLWQTF